MTGLRDQLSPSAEFGQPRGLKRNPLECLLRFRQSAAAHSFPILHILHFSLFRISLTRSIYHYGRLIGAAVHEVAAGVEFCHPDAEPAPRTVRADFPSAQAF